MKFFEQQHDQYLASRSDTLHGIFKFSIENCWNISQPWLNRHQQNSWKKKLFRNRKGWDRGRKKFGIIMENKCYAMQMMSLTCHRIITMAKKLSLPYDSLPTNNQPTLARSLVYFHYCYYYAFVSPLQNTHECMYILLNNCCRCRCCFCLLLKFHFCPEQKIIK